MCLEVSDNKEMHIRVNVKRKEGNSSANKPWQKNAALGRSFVDAKEAH